MLSMWPLLTMQRRKGAICEYRSKRANTSAIWTRDFKGETSSGKSPYRRISHIPTGEGLVTQSSFYVWTECFPFTRTTD